MKRWTSMWAAMIAVAGMSGHGFAQEAPNPDKAAESSPIPIAEQDEPAPRWIEAICPSNNRWFGGGEYLLWWMKGSPTPALVTTSTDPKASPLGAFGSSGTQVIYGGSDVGTAAHPGGRLNIGYWFNDDHTIGLNLSGFGLGTAGSLFAMSSYGYPALTRPYSVTTGSQESQVVSGLQPSTQVLDTGTVIVRYQSELSGAEANLRGNLLSGRMLSIDLLAGFRNVDLVESLSIDAQSSPSTASFAGTVREFYDQFRTSNHFYGGQFGAAFEFKQGRWSLDVMTKVGLGGTQSQVAIGGSTLVSVIDNGKTTQSSFSQSGGLLTAATNIGTYNHSQFSVVPELGVNFGFQVTPYSRVFAGYSFLYWSNVARPGSQIDTVLSPMGQTTSHPSFVFQESGFWVQGLQAGLEFRF